MIKADLQLLERQLMEEVVKRRKLGGYNSEAESVLLLAESLYRVVGHLVEKAK